MIHDRILIQIRERSFLDLLDLTLLIVRERPLSLGLAALAGITPFAVLNVWLLSDATVPRVIWLPLLVMETPWATAPLTLVLGDLMFGSRPSFAKYSRTLAVSLPSLVFTQLFLRGLLLATVVGYPIVIWRFAFLNEVILLERVRRLLWMGRRRVLGRGSEEKLFTRLRKLSLGFEGELLMRWMAQVALGLTFALCFWMGSTSISSTFSGSELTWYQPGLSDMSGLLFQFAVWLAIAFFGVFRFLAYIDRRIRLEGWELELRLKEAGRVLEGRVD
jgi:hypothetical protein